MSKVRCAIYTRKSSEVGLEQDFNSLHAQREACAAYVASQTSEGWSLLPETYNDGGLSGGTLERPALKRLMADIADGQIDIVVVYKVDRLTRSLLDFARLVEMLDKAGTSFVSVTQSFNTTTSMGRLTLNMLLSFAQFEREVTAERIRDKIAASKAKGMWMGGTPPLGYKPDGRSLAIVAEHSVLIGQLFERYLALGNVRLLAEQLETEGTRVPHRTALTGRTMGGGRFTRGQIYQILSNPIYIGEIHHRGKVYPGIHRAIISRDLWDQVQARLADNVQGNQRAATAKDQSLLAGLVFDDQGEPLVAAHACKGKVRYRYYVSRTLQHEGTSDKTKGLRIPALELEKAVAQGIAGLFDNPLALAQRCAIDIKPDEMLPFTARAEAVAHRMRKRELGCFRGLIGKVTIGRDAIEVAIKPSAIAGELGLQFRPDAASTITIAIAAQLKRSGHAVRFIQPGGTTTSPEPQQHLIRLLGKAKAWWKEMVDGELNVTDLARGHGVTDSYATRIVRLNFLAPGIVETILAGRQPAALDARALLGVHDLAPDWQQQARQLQMG